MHQLKEFVGVWRLVSCKSQTSGEKTIHYPLGEDAQGLLSYTASGYMSVYLMRVDRPRFASGDMRGGTAEEIKAAFEGFVAYGGRYEVDRDGGVVTHHVEGSLFPNWIGQAQKRFFELSGNRLILKTPPILLGGAEFVNVLVWERLD